MDYRRLSILHDRLMYLEDEDIIKSDETLREFLDQLIRGENGALIQSVLDPINMELREMGLQW